MSDASGPSQAANLLAPFSPHFGPGRTTVADRADAAGSFTFVEPFGHRLKPNGLCKGLRTTDWGVTMRTFADQATRRPVQLLPRSLRDYEPRLHRSDQD